MLNPLSALQWAAVGLTIDHPLEHLPGVCMIKLASLPLSDSNSNNNSNFTEQPSQCLVLLVGLDYAPEEWRLMVILAQEGDERYQDTYGNHKLRPDLQNTRQTSRKCGWQLPYGITQHCVQQALHRVMPVVAS